EGPRAHVGDHGDGTGHAVGLVDHPDHVRHQGRGQVVDDEVAEVLELLGGRAATGTCHAGDDHQFTWLCGHQSSSISPVAVLMRGPERALGESWATASLM